MTTRYCLLQQDALLHITGPDSLKFLQGQTTCDTESVTSSQSVNGAYCTPQGRVVCDFQLSQLGAEHFGLRMRRDIIANTAEIFGKYIIFSKAELDPQRTDWDVIAVWGEEAAATITKVIEANVKANLSGKSSTASEQGLVIVQTDSNGNAFECYVEAARKEAFLSRLADAAMSGEEAHWQAQQIANGIARIELATVEEFVPQVINYDLTDHVNFKKGCYTGQEVVARLHYRGTPKQRTFFAQFDLAQFSQSAPPAAGTALYLTDAEQSVGTIVNCAKTEDGISGLVAVKTTAASLPLHVGGQDGPAFTVNPPPYDLGLN